MRRRHTLRRAGVPGDGDVHAGDHPRSSPPRSAHLTNKEVASTLDCSARTVGHHLEHIYDKLGISTRSAATLFALKNDLVPDPVLD